MMGMRRGFSLVEILVAVAVLLVSLVSVIAAFQLSLRQGRGSLEKIQAAALAEEGVEAMAAIRDAAWTNISSLLASTTYGLSFDGVRWNTTTNPQPIDGVFWRTVSVHDVYRRTADNDIVSTNSPDPKAIDAGTKKIIVRVAWATTTPSGGGAQVLERYLMNLFE